MTRARNMGDEPMSWWNPLAWSGTQAPKDNIWSGVGSLLGDAPPPVRPQIPDDAWAALVGRGPLDLIGGIGRTVRTGARAAWTALTTCDEIDAQQVAEIVAIGRP